MKVNFYSKVYFRKDRKSSEATTVLGRENEILRLKNGKGCRNLRLSQKQGESLKSQNLRVWY